jgi:transposase
VRPRTRPDRRVGLLATIPGRGEISRFSNARKLIRYAVLAPTIKQPGQSSWTGRIPKAGPPTLRWAATEAAQHSWRPSSPWHPLYPKTKHRHGKTNPAKTAVAGKILIASWYVLSRQQPFKRHAPISPDTCPGKLPDDLPA